MSDRSSARRRRRTGVTRLEPLEERRHLSATAKDVGSLTHLVGCACGTCGPIPDRQFAPLDRNRPAWREPILRFTRARLKEHLHPEAVAEALRQVPRSVPFEGLSELENLDVPSLVVASHDVADPGHPYAVAEAWEGALPNARLISEAEGEAHDG